MSELEPISWSKGAQALLEAERAAPPPADALADALWSRLARSIDALPPAGGSGEPGAGSSAAGSGAAGAGAAGAGVAGAKLAIVSWPVAIAFALGGVVGVAAHAGYVGQSAPPAVIAPNPVAAPAAIVPEPIAPAPADEPAPSPAVEPEPVRPDRVRAKKVEAPKNAEPAGPEAGLSMERALLEQARTALHRGEAAAALEALERHRAQAPAGRLAEERDALEVQALVANGRAREARVAGRHFHERYPSSIYGPVVDHALAP